MGRRRKAVGALPQVNLVEVDLKDLVFGKVAFDFVSHRHFVDLTGVGTFRRQEEVACDLHRDGGTALTFATGEKVRESSAGDAGKFNAGMLVETVVFSGEHRVFHKRRHVLEMHEVTPLFAEFADQGALGAVDAKRNFRSVVGEGINRRQLFVDDGEDEHDDACGADGAEHTESHEPQKTLYPERRSDFG